MDARTNLSAASERVLKVGRDSEDDALLIGANASTWEADKRERSRKRDFSNIMVNLIKHGEDERY